MGLGLRSISEQYSIARIYSTDMSNASETKGQAGLALTNTLGTLRQMEMIVSINEHPQWQTDHIQIKYQLNFLHN